MVVLQCCLGEFSLYFLLAVLLGVVLRQLLLMAGKGSTHMATLAAVGYVVCELFASKIYAGLLPGQWALFLGVACLGLFLGGLLHWLILRLNRGRAAPLT
ncbi:MAG: hypothetical protein MR910_06075 [Clostridiales bacterium]|nr:hypothetical protein [Clostridiales bacterium]